jgi:hypothetical protein
MRVCPNQGGKQHNVLLCDLIILRQTFQRFRRTHNQWTLREYIGNLHYINGCRRFQFISKSTQSSCLILRTTFAFHGSLNLDIHVKELRALGILTEFHSLLVVRTIPRFCLSISIVFSMELTAC